MHGFPGRRCDPTRPDLFTRINQRSLLLWKCSGVRRKVYNGPADLTQPKLLPPNLWAPVFHFHERVWSASIKAWNTGSQLHSVWVKPELNVGVDEILPTDGWRLLSLTVTGQSQTNHAPQKSNKSRRTHPDVAMCTSGHGFVLLVVGRRRSSRELS